MNTVERFDAIMAFKPFDRLPIIEWAMWWDKTVERWKAEGLRLERGSASGRNEGGPTHPTSNFVQERYELCRHFGLDVYYQRWVPHALPGLPQAPSHGAGIVEDMDGYSKLKGCLFPSSDFIAGGDLEAWEAERRRGDAVIWFTLEGFFWFPRTLLGIEPHLYAFYDKPELLRQMNDDLADFHLRAIDAICERCKPSFMSFAEDLSYNNGPMLSEAHFDEFLLPYYKRVIPRLKERGIIPFIDSDGDVAKAMPWFERAGLEGVLPLERQAGVDVSALREAHPKARFIGAFDKMTMNQGEARMRKEFERLMATARKGGFLISCDHQTPPGVSLEDYELYLRLFREYAEKV